MHRLFWFCAFCLIVAFPVRGLADEITPAGQRLSKFLDNMDVEHLWLPGGKVKWQTGEPLDKPVMDGNKHTHCSAFVAAACQRLDIYILRPPDHSATMLANAQFDWLHDEGKKEGWKPVRSAQQAQAFANRGYLVVATCKENGKAGHIAIVRPSTKSAERIENEGPQIIQAGRTNYKSASLKRGFKNHPREFREKRIRYYAHKVSEKSPS